MQNNKKIIKYQFNKFNPIGMQELYAATKVIKSGMLSGFLAGTGKEFLGGKYVRKFEKKLQTYFKVRYAITVNSWTSGLVAAIGSLSPKTGDEIIVPTWTMSACAAAILNWKAIPVFCDIKKDDFTIDVKKAENLITKKTIAIMAVDLFGSPCDYKELINLKKKYKIKIISDSAQAITAKYKDKYVSTFVDIGGYSFNRHKHINTGEGGVLITNNKIYAKKLRLLRNHAESSLAPNNHDMKDMFGFNFRLGEIESAIGIEQLKKLKNIVNNRRAVAKNLTLGLQKLRGLNVPHESNLKKHVYYFYPMTLNMELIKTEKKKIIYLLEKEGVQGICGKYNSLHLLPIFNKNNLKSKKFFSVAEELNNKTFIAIKLCILSLDKNDVRLIIKAFEKVWKKIKFY
jgi:dTDP-4-amino-4,6-dideoxygalactose transaminase